MPSTRVRFHFILVISFVLTPLHASADTINACAKKNNGKLRLVADPGQCKDNEAPVSWESEGPVESVERWVSRHDLATTSLGCRRHLGNMFA